MFEFFDVEYKDILKIPGMKIERGITALLGVSGSGKTTVLRMLNKMISPTAGKILYKGKDIKEYDSVELRREVMMLSQDPVIFQGSIRDNLIIAFVLQGREYPNDSSLEKVLTKVLLDKPLDDPAAQLSGGEKQRLALARLLLLDPEVYLLDEPSSALDSDTEDMIIGMLSEKAKEESGSVIIVTHSRAIAEKYADTIFEMPGGRIIHRRSDHGKNH